MTQRIKSDTQELRELILSLQTLLYRALKKLKELEGRPPIFQSVGGGSKTTSFADLVDTIADAQASQFLLLDGTRKMTGNLVMDGNKIDLGSGTPYIYKMSSDIGFVKTVSPLAYANTRHNLVQAWLGWESKNTNAQFKARNNSTGNVIFYTQWGGLTNCAQLLTTGSGTGEFNISAGGDITGLAGKTLDFPTVNVDTLGDSGAGYVNMASDLVVPATKGLDCGGAEYMNIPLQAPSTPSAGDMYFDTATDKLYVRDAGSVWKSVTLT